MDTDPQARIDELEAEQTSIRRREGAADPTQEADVARLEEIRVELDRLWDLKRQRTALSNAGQDPDGARERPADVVEHYRQ